MTANLSIRHQIPVSELPSHDPVEKARQEGMTRRTERQGAQNEKSAWHQKRQAIQAQLVPVIAFDAAAELAKAEATIERLAFRSLNPGEAEELAAAISQLTRIPALAKAAPKIRARLEAELVDAERQHAAASARLEALPA